MTIKNLARYAQQWQYGDCEGCSKTGVSVATIKLGYGPEADFILLCMICLIKDIERYEEAMERDLRG